MASCGWWKFATVGRIRCYVGGAGVARASWFVYSEPNAASSAVKATGIASTFSNSTTTASSTLVTTTATTTSIIAPPTVAHADTDDAAATAATAATATSQCCAHQAFVICHELLSRR